MDVQGRSKVITFTPVLSLAPYADGDQMGVLMKLADILENSSSDASIVSLAILDKAKQNSAFEVLLFDQDPIISSVDNAPLDISDAEMAAKFIGSIFIAAADYSNLVGSSYQTIDAIGMLIQGRQFRDVWAVCKCRGTPTYTSASDLVLKIGVYKD